MRTIRSPRPASRLALLLGLLALLPTAMHLDAPPPRTDGATAAAHAGPGAGPELAGGACPLCLAAGSARGLLGASAPTPPPPATIGRSRHAPAAPGPLASFPASTALPRAPPAA